MTADGATRVLYVGRDEDGRSGDRLASERDGFEVTVATSLADALAALREGGIDCVVGEHELSDGDGLELLAAVRGAAPDVPFVLFPADGDEALASRAISAGVTDYVREREGYDELADRVEAAVEEADDERAVEDSGAERGPEGAEAVSSSGDEAEAVSSSGDERLALFVERSPLAIVEWNREFEVVRWNEAAADLFGYDEREARGRQASFLVPPDEREHVEDVTDQLLSDEGGYHSVNENVTKGGERVRCEWHNRIVTDEAGEVVAIFSLVRDVTERHERQRAMRTLHDATREMVAADSREAIVEAALDAAVDVLGLTQTGVHFYDEAADALVPVAWTGPVEENVGEPPSLGPDSLAWSVFQEGEASRFDDLWDTEGVYNPDTPFRSEVIASLGEHGVALFSSTDPGAFDDDDQRFAELLCANATVALDRASRETALRRRERELRRENRRLDEFTRVVSHDIRNPLNLAKGEVGLAAEEYDGEHLEVAADALDRMERLVDDLLALAREGRRVDAIEPVSLSAAARSAWLDVAAADATLRVDGDATLAADEDRLVQAFTNLFRNSVDHGGDRVTVEVGPLERDDAVVGFYVEDDGPGVPPAARERVFELGFTTDAEGTGFGLNIVEDIVEAHGWRIDLTEGAGGGARFEVTGVDVADA